MVLEGFVLVVMLVGWNWLLDWVSFCFNVVCCLVDLLFVVLVWCGYLIVCNMC